MPRKKFLRQKNALLQYRAKNSWHQNPFYDATSLLVARISRECDKYGTLSFSIIQGIEMNGEVSLFGNA